MNVIVDFDNLHDALKIRSLFHVVNILTESILSIVPHAVQPPLHLIFRLYSGWYEDNRITQNAQKMNAELVNVPAIRGFHFRSKKHPVRLRAELASAILALPTWPLFKTYRPKSNRLSVRTFEQAEWGCPTPSSCQLACLPEFFEKRRCPKSGCGVRSSAVAFRSEQKLVDTMMAVDLLYSAAVDGSVVIISSDDDPWPPILQALAANKTVYHINTRAGQDSSATFLPRQQRYYLFKDISGEI